MNWGYRIFFSFVLFIALIVTLVVISMRQDINLVAEDYYRQEIEYQDQIDRLKRTRDLERQPEITLKRKEGILVVALNQKEFEEGKAVFFRPSDAGKDRTFALENAEEQVFPVGDWEKGMWKVRLSWTSGGKEYYTEKVITL